MIAFEGTSTGSASPSSCTTLAKSNKKRTTIELIEFEDDDGEEEEEEGQEGSRRTGSKPKCHMLKVQRGAVSFCVTVPAHLADMMTGCLSRALSSGVVSDIKANAVL